MPSFSPAQIFPFFADEAYNAGKFTASGAMTWTVQAGDCIIYRYSILGNLMIVWFDLQTTSIAGIVNNDLFIQIPAGKLATSQIGIALPVWDNGVNQIGQMYTQAGGNKIGIERLPLQVWSASINNTRVFGMITFQFT